MCPTSRDDTPIDDPISGEGAGDSDGEGSAFGPEASVGDLTETLAGPGPPGGHEPRSRESLDRGEMLGRYLVLDYLGGGGMGVVYTAYDPNLDRKVAVKLLRTEVMSHRASEARRRLVQEARALAKLAHPHVVAVHDIGSVGNQVFLAMEHVEGKDLRRWLSDEQPDWQRVIEVFAQAGEGLAAAHRAGLLHRDFKPANVILGDDGRARVLDFGLAAQTRPQTPSGPDASAAGPAAELADASSRPGDPVYREAPSRAASALDAHAGGDGPVGAGDGPVGTGDGPVGTGDGSGGELLAAAGTGASAEDEHATAAGASDIRPRSHRSGRSGSAADRGAARDRPAPLGQLTEPGTRVGTPAYMSPEQLRGRAIDARSDQFGFCVALYEALWQRSPFPNRYDRPTGVDESEVIVPPPADSPVPADVAAAVMRGLATAPDDRFEHMEALLEALQPAARRRGWALGASLAAALLLAVLAVGPWREAPCADLGQHWVGVWDGAREAKIRGQYAASDLPWAVDLWGGLSRRLDRYTEQWTGMRTESCEATRVRGEQSENLLDLRNACLDQRLYEVRALTELLAEADDDAIRRSSRAVGSLSPLEPCADAEALLAVVPPPDPAMRERADSVRNRIAETKALYSLGQNQKAYDSGQELRSVIAGLDYAPVEAEALQAIALAAEIHDRREESRSAHLDAVARADAGHHDEVRLRSLLSLTWLDLGDLPSARRWLELARGVTDRLDSTYFTGLWHRFESELFRNEGDYPEALRAAERAVEAFRGLLGTDHPDTLNMLSTRVDMLFVSGRNAEALEILDEIVRAKRETLGASHPEVAYAEIVQAQILGRLDRHEEALGILERAFAVVEQTHGLDHSYTANVLEVLGNTRSGLGLLEEAREALGQALAIRLARDGEDSHRVADLRNDIALVYWQEGRLPEAESGLREAARIYRETRGADHPKTWNALTNLGRVAIDQGRHTEAARVLEPAYRSARASLGPDHATTLHAGLGLGTAWLGTGRVAEGGALIDEVAARAEEVGVQDWLLATLRFSQAKLASARGDRSAAEARAAEARALFETLGRAGEADLALIDAWARDAGEG